MILYKSFYLTLYQSTTTLLFELILIYIIFHMSAAHLSPLFWTLWILWSLFISFSQYKEPTHVKGHTLDLVLYSALSPDYLKTEDICVSDHEALLFSGICTRLPLNHLSAAGF